MPDQPDIPVEDVLESHRQRFGQVIAVAIVVTTLLAALCGYLQAHSLQRNSDARSRGQAWGALSVQLANENQQIEQLYLARYRSAEGDRLQAATFASHALLGSSSSSDRLAISRWQQVADHVGSDSNALAAGIRGVLARIHHVDNAGLPEPRALLVDDGPDCPVGPWAQTGSLEGRVPPPIRADALGEGPNQDPNFPAVYVADGQRQVVQLDGLRDAANTESAQAEKQFTRYAVSLAILAVAVFMLGYSLTPHGRHHRKLYAAAAGILVVGASLWGVYAAVRSPHRAAPEAIAAYADGRVATERRAFPLAVRYFTCAIRQDPSFAPAFAARANAIAGQAQTLYQLTPDQLRRTIADDQRAVDLGSSDPAALNELSAGLFVQGLRRADPGLVQKAGQFVARAHQSDPSNPTIAMNFAEDQLMLGVPATRAYDAEIQAVAKSHPGDGQASLSSLESDLETRLGRQRRAAILAAKQRVVAALSAGSPVAGTSVSSPTLVVTGPPSLSPSIEGGIAPAQLEFFLRSGHGFVPSRDHLYAVWYERAGPAWQAIDGSGPVTLQTDQQNALFALSTVRSQCLGANQYRLELFVNGRLAGQTNADYHSPTLQHAGLGDMAFSLCHPASWRRTPAWQPGLFEGFQSPSGRSGMLVVDATAAGASPRLLDHVVQSLGRRVPRGLRRARALPDNEFAGGMCHTYVQENTYPGGILAAGIGRDGFGRQLAGLVYGPKTMFDDHGPAPSLASDLFTSMISSEPTATC